MHALVILSPGICIYILELSNAIVAQGATKLLTNKVESPKTVPVYKVKGEQSKFAPLHFLATLVHVSLENCNLSGFLADT